MSVEPMRQTVKERKNSRNTGFSYSSHIVYICVVQKIDKNVKVR